MLMPDNTSGFTSLPAGAMGDKYVQPSPLTTAALNAQNAKTLVGTHTLKGGPKQVSLQRRTIEEQIAHERHDRSLDKWKKQQEDWERFRHQAASKTGRAKEDL